MPKPPLPIPVLMLYDPDEFWEQVRDFVREAIVQAQTPAGGLQAALDKSGLPLKPAYTLTEIRQLFHLSVQTLDEWIQNGLLPTARMGRQSYILYADLLQRFQASTINPSPSP